MKGKKLLAFGLAICLCLSLAACARQPEHLSLGTVPEAGGQTEPETPAEEGPKAVGVTFVDSSECKYSELAEGTLYYTVTGVRVVSNVADIPEGGFDEYLSKVTLYDENGNRASHNYPEYIGISGREHYISPDLVQEDGEFLEGAYLVLMDVTVESLDARAWTVDDIDEQTGYSKSDRTDPYIFIVYLDLRDKNEQLDDYTSHDGSKNRDQTWDIPCFYSNMAEQQELREQGLCNTIGMFRLEPGQSRDMTIGWLVGNKMDGSPRSFSGMYLWLRLSTYGEPCAWGSYLDLNIKDEE